MEQERGDIGRRGVIATSAWGETCPFRGQLPFRIKLDHRCPPTLTCHVLPVDTGTARIEGGMEPHVVPILQAESYCSTCVNTMVREREAGLVVRERHGAGSIARPKRSRRAGAIVGGAHTLKEAQHMIAERMAARA